MKSSHIRCRIIAVAVLALVSTYSWACYIAGDCTCAVVGSCYSRRILPNCQVPTCLIADTSASVWNVCPGSGPYTGRTSLEVSACCPSACRVYDSCAHQYLLYLGGACCFEVQRFQGTGSSCQ